MSQPASIFIKQLPLSDVVANLSLEVMSKQLLFEILSFNKIIFLNKLIKEFLSLDWELFKPQKIMKQEVLLLTLYTWP